MNRLSIYLLVAGLVSITSGCGRDTYDANVKMVGVGYNPDEIGPIPTEYGGVAEYNWLNFAGAGLSLGFAGLLSFTEVDSSTGFSPPYAMVYGFSYIFDAKIAGAGNVGTLLPPPNAEEVCYTTFETTGPLGSFTTTDLGNAITFETESGGFFEANRMPTDYPPDPQDMFIYYSAIEAWRPKAAIGYLPGSSSSLQDMQQTVLRAPNFPHGETALMKFPGGVAAEHAPVGSLPLPSSYTGDIEIKLPNRQEGLMLSWTGPRYNADGELVEGTEHSTCMSYYWPEDSAVTDPSQCLEKPEFKGDDGQVYTGPWDTQDGLKFNWVVPEEGSDEIVTISIRYLANDLDDTDELKRYMVDPLGTNYVEGRDAIACEEGEWVFDPDIFNEDGSYILPLQGNPLHTVSEVTCRLKDDGEFILTQDLLAKAQELADQNNVSGAIMMFGRSSKVEATVPDVKDAYDNRREISPILVNARTVEIGRFWYGDSTSTGQEE